MDVLHSFQAENNVLVWAAVVTVLSISLLLPQIANARNAYAMSKFPLVGAEYGGQAKRAEAFWFQSKKLYETAYQKFSDRISRITTTSGDHLIIPNRYLDELKGRPDDDIDVLRAFKETFQNDYIHLFPPWDRTQVANSVVKVELTRNLARLNYRLSEEVRETIEHELGTKCKANGAWTPLVIFPILLRIVAIVSGNIFVGPELCRTDEYLSAALDFTVDTTSAAEELKKWPSWLKPFAVKFDLCPSLVRSRAQRRNMREFLRPIVLARRKLKKEGKEVPDDMLEWMIEKGEANGIMDIGHLTDMLLLLIVAAIHTTTVAAMGIMFDLATHPDVVKDVRAEIASVLAENDGVMTANALFHMKLMDSVMRESQRVSPPFIDTFRRYVRRPITLKDGTYIPAGTYFETPSLAVLNDPQLYPDPETYNPYRYYDIRTKKDVVDPINFKNREQYQFVSVTKENMTFGFGKHACPGRFFASNEIKLIVASILLNYDVKMPQDKKGRYQTTYVGIVAIPDPTAVVEFRRGS